MTEAGIDGNAPATRRDADWYEVQYNPRTTVADTARVLAGWGPRAGASRAELHPVEHRYGPHPRELFDLMRPADPRGTVVYIHGGYWRMLSKYETSWVADGFVPSGYSVALFNYPLCPEVGIGDIAASMRSALAALWRTLPTAAERDRLVVVGHSAGGYLCGTLATAPWGSDGLPPVRLAGIVPISGLFELEPLVWTSMNKDLNLDAATARALSLSGRRPAGPLPVTAIVGGDESQEFKRQGRLFAEAPGFASGRYVEVPGTNHFTVIDGLAAPGSPVHREVMDLLTRSGPA